MGDSMLEKILFLFYVTAAPILFLIRITKIKSLGLIYGLMVNVKLVPVLWSLYGVNLATSFLQWKWVQFKVLIPKLFGHKHYNREYVEMKNKKIPGTDYHFGYISDDLPRELIYKWRRDKVFHNYIASVITANHDYVNVALKAFEAPKPIADDALKNFILSSQVVHYLQKENGELIFDMSTFHQEQVLPNMAFEVKRIVIAESLALSSMRIEMFDGTVVRCGEAHWDLAKIYFLSNTMVFFILGAHLHHHLLFAEMGAVSLFNRVSKNSNFHKLLHHHTSYILMLNDQFKINPLSLRETTGIVDKFLYSCIGYYAPDTFYKVGYENALNMYGKRDTIDEALTKKAGIKFTIPFDQYMTGDATLNQQLKVHYATVKEFVTSVYDDLVAGEGKTEVSNWVNDVCRYVHIDVTHDRDFYIEVIATYIWYVSFVHSMEHYQFYKLMDHYCLLIRKPFSQAVNMKESEVFSQYDLWKSKHIVLTFGKNHLNKNISESYFDVDYGFACDVLKEKQAQFKSKVQVDLSTFNIPAEAIALSIRY